MEFIRVGFDPADIREVIVSGDPLGPTESVLLVQPNYYVVSLSGSGYVPLYWHGFISGTTRERPLEIRFARG